MWEKMYLHWKISFQLIMLQTRIRIPEFLGVLIDDKTKENIKVCIYKI